MMIDKDFVYQESRKTDYDVFNDKWVVGPISYSIKDKKKRAPKMYFLNKEDMMTVYKLLRSRKMVFGCEEE